MNYETYLPINLIDYVCSFILLDGKQLGQVLGIVAIDGLHSGVLGHITFTQRFL